MSTKKCANCGKEIESFKMILHERFCSLNVRKCSICEEPILIDEYKEHKNSKHEDKKCEQCGKTFPNSLFSEHQKSCSKKLIACQYCGLFLIKSELHEHEYQCGSKTQPCEYCGENVPIMEYDLHLQYTCKIRAAFDNNKKNKKLNDNLENIEKILSHDEKKKNKKMEIKSKSPYNMGKKILFEEEESSGKKNKNYKNTNKENGKEINKKKSKNNEYNTSSNSKGEKKSDFKFMSKFSGDYINDSEEMNNLDFDDDIVDLTNINSDNKKFSEKTPKKNDTLSKNNEEDIYIINETLLNKNSKKKCKNQTKNPTKNNKSKSSSVDNANKVNKSNENNKNKRKNKRKK